ncbi:hypothetical protein [Bacillus sp. S10(2024)]|uniref:hypothetical protein n=1 Tax=Bacillus sp. S10(2024) TaxID=3162886 RepID=UPI003D23A34B
MSPENLDWQNIFEFTMAIIIFGAPMVLVGCIIGELLYRYYIVPKSLPFKLALVIYALLGSIVMLFIIIVLGGNIQNITDLFNLQLIGFPAICSIVFFIKRNTYK